MNAQKKAERTRRVRSLNRVLKKLYPDLRIQLRYGNTWELLVAVILSAQCTDARVNMVTKKLFKKYRTVRAYAEAPKRELERDIYQCGFFRSKAKNISGAARRILEHHNGMVPMTMEELIALPGVGRKTANVVLSNAFGVHEGIAVDTHVRRFAIRFDLSDHTDPKRIEKDLMAIMPKEEWWGFNHRLVMYGREICTARKHACAGHPLTRKYAPADERWPRAR